MKAARSPPARSVRIAENIQKQRGWEIKYRFRLSINGELSKLFSVIRIEFIFV